MKKPFKFSDKSENHYCRHCGKKLKKNLLEKNPDADLCYKCYMWEIRGNTMYRERYKKISKGIIIVSERPELRKKKKEVQS